jgi:uncharacterized protein DUF5335
MFTVDVPRKDWPSVLGEFSAIHEGWLVSLDVMGSDLGVQPQFRDVPLRGIVAETTLSEPAITIVGGRPDGGRATHVIHGPAHVRIERTPEGADVALEVESGAGLTAILRFKTVALPETVDGIARPR